MEAFTWSTESVAAEHLIPRSYLFAIWQAAFGCLGVWLSFGFAAGLAPKG
jgi:hypothetical protein